MPYSSNNGKWFTTKFINKLKKYNIKNILDVGPGSGTYSNLYKNIIGEHWTAVEIWEPYIEKFNLKSKYHEVINENILNILDYSKYNLIFLGDILEHMEKDKAQELVKNILHDNNFIIISIPIVYYPQDEYDGNPYEKHIKDDWTHKEVLESFDNIKSYYIHDDIGVYIISKIENNDLYNIKPTIACYTICKNEEQFVQRWCDSNKQADYRIVCDTGSNDKTIELLKNNNVDVFEITINPWRFDTARNTALFLIPEDIDICISQDMDEVLEDNWYDELIKNWKPDFNRIFYKFRTNNSPYYWHEKIHSRHNYYWKYPVHEKLIFTGDNEKTQFIETLKASEIQDITKDRNYLELNLQSLKEGDTYWKRYFFISNDYEKLNDFENSIKYKILSYDNCNDGNNVKSYIAKNIATQYMNNGNYKNAEEWFNKGISDDPYYKEIIVEYGKYLYIKNDWELLYSYMIKAIRLNTIHNGFTYDINAWGYLPYDLLSLACYHLNLKDKSIEYCKKAIELNPYDNRLQNNLKYFQEK